VSKAVEILYALVLTNFGWLASWTQDGFIVAVVLWVLAVLIGLHVLWRFISEDFV
jgi:hypothetical protein